MSWIKLHPIKDSKDAIDKLKILFPSLNKYQNLEWIKAPSGSLLYYRLRGIDPDHKFKYSTLPSIFTGESWSALKNKELYLKYELGSYIIEASNSPVNVKKGKLL
jgi:hypothetical protein